MEEAENLLAIIRKISFFQSLPGDKASEIVAALIPVSFMQDEVVFSQDEESDSLYIVTEGLVELYTHDYSGEKIILKSAGPTMYFGELSMLEGGTRSANAKAIEASVCMELKRVTLLEFLKQQPDIAVGMLSELSKEIRKTNKLLAGRISRNPNIAIEEDLSYAQRSARFIAAFSGSMPFLVINGLWFLCWILMNINIIHGLTPFDPYPFGFLTLAVSLEAIFLSIFVLLSQNVQVARDKIQRDIEYEVNLKAELEIAYLHEKIDRFQEENMKMLHALVQRN